ncbi:hypothetical protein CDAR_43741 [Caerostris darwini]|uniref:Uncharacterized protein n=1 Tax=Caerostris darwini TaxID=1538125 RepID=A0AAV4WH29_9ARAC|nr:hypothetical protein CDAR_43741 [Caerostris darwini]
MENSIPLLGSCCKTAARVLQPASNSTLPSNRISFGRGVSKHNHTTKKYEEGSSAVKATTNQKRESPQSHLLLTLQRYTVYVRQQETIMDLLSLQIIVFIHK